MKFTVILIIALVAFSADALKLKKINSAQITRINEIRKTNTWAGILLNLAELHATARGPLDELIQAMEDTIQELGYKREKREEEYEKRTAEHEALVQQLESDIARCESDIAETESMLVMLAEQKAELEEENRGLATLIDNTNTAIAEATRVRAQEHEEYELKVAETEQAIEAVDECLTILNDFANGGEIAFVQIKNAKSRIQNAQNKIARTKNMETIFLNNLIQVAMNQEFADSGAVQKVIDKFNEIRGNLLDSSAQLKIDEEMSQSNFEKFVADSKQVISESNDTIEYNNGLLVQNAANTEENLALLAQLQADKAAFEQQLADEHQSYDEYVERYTAWCEENDREVAVLKEALAVVATVDMDDYILDRVNAEDGMVSSGMAGAEQHGMGTEVFNFDYQF